MITENHQNNEGNKSMPRGGARQNTGGARPGAGRKRSKPNITIELTEQATQALAYFIEDLNLNRGDASAIVSAIVSTALAADLDQWRDRFGNQE
jgi:hypothetical protein